MLFFTKRKLFFVRVLLLPVLLLCSYIVKAQNLDQIGETEDPLKLSGGLTVDQVGYFADGIESRRDPYSYYLSANLTASIYGWSVPVSFSYSNQNSRFQQPFNQYGITPSYKWATAYIGYNSMSFSKYSLSGFLFNGVGVKLNPPGKFDFQAMYGRMQKAVEPDTLGDNRAQPAFKRMGYGFKAGYKNGNHGLDVILFHGQDNPASLQTPLDSLDISPQENLVLSLKGEATILEKVQLQAEWAGSAVTENLLAEPTDYRPPNVFGYTSGLYSHRTSSAYYNAYNASASYAGKGYQVGVQFEHIDPGYKTHGAYYFNNDLRNITVNSSVALFKGKVNVNTRLGRQRNNLENEQMSSTRRWVGSMNVSYNASEKLNFNVSYSNFQTFTRIQPLEEQLEQQPEYERLDTLNDYAQISQNANVNMSYNISQTENIRQSLNVNLSVQKTSDNQQPNQQSSGTQYGNVNIGYNRSWQPINLSLNAGINANRNFNPSAETMAFGPTAGLSKSFFDKKLRARFSTSVNRTYASGTNTGQVVNLRLSGNYTFLESHSLNLSFSGLDRKRKGQEQQGADYSELTINLSYNYNF